MNAENCEENRAMSHLARRIEALSHAGSVLALDSVDTFPSD